MRIVLAQPYRLVLEALERLLEAFGLDVVGGCNCVDDLEQCLRRHDLDVALMDTLLSPGGDAGALVRAARRGLDRGRLVLLVPEVAPALAREALALEVDGTPFAYERVCFYVDDKADSYRLFSGVTGPAAARFRVTSEQAPTPSSIHPDVRCAYLDANGNAALEVFNSGDQTINVIAEYIDEGLLRDIDAIFGAGDGPGDPPSTDAPPNSGEGEAPPSSGAGSNPPSTTQVVQTAGDNSHLLGGTKTATAAKKARLSKSRIVRVGSKRYLQVKVISSAKTAKLAIRLTLRSGKVLKGTRTVKTNRTVRVMRLSSAVKSARVSLK